MAKSKSASMGLAMQMLIGLVLGVIVGMFLDSQFATTYVKPFRSLGVRHLGCRCRRYFRRQQIGSCGH